MKPHRMDGLGLRNISESGPRRGAVSGCYAIGVAQLTFNAEGGVWQGNAINKLE